ncbi:hypothetical protein BDY24DRAFT_17879 [Mrakia frigida]|uniref:RNA polymerase-associated protein n=1 Tax=Mrakia frigida TaxID=29902 RepID=UPI003FCBF958
MDSDDLSEELLALADDPSSKKRSKSKRPRPSVSSSDEDEQQPMDLESEDDGPSASSTLNPYPLEGRFKDEADRAKIMSLPEVQREQVIADREGEKAKVEQKRQLDNMFKNRQGEDTVAKAAKRQHTLTGTSSTKSRKLEELKNSRVEKKERQSRKAGSGTSPRRRAAASDSSDEEDGGVSRYSEDEAERRSKKASEQIEIYDLERVRLSRGDLAGKVDHPSFDEYVIGGFVRYMVGQHEGKSVYRAFEVVGVEKYKMYQFENTRDDRKLVLKLGKSERTVTMEQVSNSPFTDEEFRRWRKELEAVKIALPKKSQLLRKKEEWAEILSRKLTDADITAMVAKKAAGKSKASSTQLELNRRRAEHTMAIKRQDYDAAESIADIIRALEEDLAVNVALAPTGAVEDYGTMLNEKNRKAQAEAIRKSDAEKKELRRLANLAGEGGAGKRFKGLGTSSEANTPLSGSPFLAALSEKPSTSIPDLSLGATATPSTKKRIEQEVVKSLDLDLGDF